VYDIGLDRLTDGSDFTGIVLCVAEIVGNEVVLVYHLVSLLRNAHLASQTIRLHLICDKHVLSEDVISHDLGANNSADNFSSVDPNTHIQIS